MKSDNGRIGFELGIDDSRLQADINKAMRSFDALEKDVKADCSSMDASFKQLGAAVAATFTVQKAIEFGKTIVSVRGEIESLEKSFEILAGKAKGGALFAEIKDFAIKTPMGMKELAKGAQTLLSFNTAAEDVMPILRAIGDISMGNKDKFNSLTLAFAQMSSTGKLMGQDLLQMINAGFNPLSVISEQTGKSIGKLKKDMEAGLITADKVKQAFMDATSEGGKFNGMLATMSQGIEGSISNLEGAFEEMLNDLGTKSQDVIVGGIQATQKLVENYEKVGKVVAELVATCGVYKAALITLNAVKVVSTNITAGYTAAELAQYYALLMVEKAQKALNATMLKNPYVLAAAGVAALAYGIYKLATYQSAAEKAQKKLNDAVEASDKSIASEQYQIDAMFARLKAATEGTDEYRAAKEAIMGKYGEYLQGLGDEKTALNDVALAYKTITEEAQKAARARAMESFTKDASDTLATATGNARSKVYDLLQKQFGGKKGADGIDLAETYYWKIVPVIEGREEITDEVKAVVEQFERTQYVANGQFGGTTSYQYNPLLDQIKKAQAAKAVYDKTMGEARVKFGEAQTKAADTTDGDKNAAKEVAKDKAYWEDYKKEQQGLLDAMTEAQLKTQEAEKIRANIALAQEKIDAYSVSKGKKAEEQENEEAIAAADRTRKIGEYTDAVTRAVAQSQFEIEQAEIDALEESYKKQSRQIDLNYRRLIKENKQRKADWVSELADAKELEWQNANPDYKKKGLVFDRSSVTEADLSADQLAVLKMYEDVANNYKAQENGKLLKKLLDEYATYEAQRTEIAKQYEDQRKQFYELNEDGSYKTNADGSKVMKQGVSQGNVDELNRQEEEALKAVDQQFAMREETFRAWMDEVANLTLEQLKAVLEQAEAELAKLEKSNPDNPKLAQARAKVSTLKDKISKKNAEDNVNPGKRSIKEWNELREALEDCIGAFNEIGNSVGDVAGEIISVTGTIMGSTLSMINGIVQLVQMSATGMTATAAAGAAAISTIEKASVILAVISAALQIAMAIVKLFDGDKKKEKNIQRLQSQIEKLERSYDKLGKSIEAAFSKDASKMIEQQNTLLRQQKVLIQQQIAEEKSKKKTDWDRIKEWEQQLEEIDDLIADNKEKAVDAIFGEDLKSAIEGFASAYAEAWANGEDRAKSAKETVKKMMQQMVTESIKAAIQSSAKMEHIRQKLQEFYADGVLTGWEQDYIYKMADELQKQIDSQFGWADSLMSGDSDSESQESTRKGFAAMSQESADELNGRFTAVQMDTSAMRDLMQQYSVDMASLRQSATDIRQHTEEMRNLSLTAIDHLEAISANTAQIYGTNERLDKIEKHLRKL